jgi:hypothetical protein
VQLLENALDGHGRRLPVFTIAGRDRDHCHRTELANKPEKLTTITPANSAVRSPWYMPQDRCRQVSGGALMAALPDLLADRSEVGDGELHHLLRDLQRKYFRPETTA